ncbi:MAG TPA: AAA family ATPase [Gaiellales bacterium]|nr:AAA family ATPase [Gaiellales bacterium]
MGICSKCRRENRPDAQFCDSCGAALTVPAIPETRKTVTILFCDVVGSTELADRYDPEVVRSIMTRYFDAARPIIERHGGTVEKFIGDAVMAAFGVPVVHEDDALRAVRAAAELREALGERQVTIRVGVATGQALTGIGETLGSGDVFNLAARLQTAAAPGEVLIADSTLALVQDAVSVDPVPPLVLKGKRGEVVAWRLVEVDAGAEGVKRWFAGELIGRRRELELLTGAFERCRAEQRCHLVTVLGEAGIGKSRLVGELVVKTAVRAGEGRCRPYGDGITYLPLAEAIAALAGDEPPAAWLQRALAADGDGAHVFDVVASTLGYAADSPAIVEEVPWAVARALEAAAADGPLMLVLDDIQWAEPPLLKVVEHVVDWVRGGPVLVVCLARPTLLEARPDWGGGKVNSTMLLLEPLSEEELTRQVADLSVGRSLDADLRRRIVETAGGNPLFAEQMVAMVESGDDRHVGVPASVQALLAARIDALGGAERAVLEAAAVDGQEFHRDAVVELAGRDVDGELRALARQELVAPARGDRRRGPLYAFRHLLIRDAAYDAISLARRAQLHTGFADWWESTASPEDADFHAILAYHLETACVCRERLGEQVSDFADLGVRAGEALAIAGRLANRRWETGAPALLSRALELLPLGHRERPGALLTLAYNALPSAGTGERMAQLLELGFEEATATGDDLLRRRMELAQSDSRIWFGQADPIEARRRQAEEAIAAFERAGEIEGIIQALGLIVLTEQDAMQAERTRIAAERTLELGRAYGDPVARDYGARGVAIALLDGPVPVDDAIARCDELIAATPGPGRATPMQFKAELLAARGEFVAARELLDESAAIMAGLGVEMVLSLYRWTYGAIDALAGRWAEAAAVLRDLHEDLVGTDERWAIAGIGTLLGEVLLEQGETDEARARVEVARQHAAPGSIYYQAWWRRAWGRLEARAGRYAVGETLVREALSMLEDSDWLYFKSQTEMALADVLRRARREPEALEAAARALELCDAKGHVAGARQVRAFIASPITEGSVS